MLATTEFANPHAHFSTTDFKQGALYYSSAALRERIAIFQNGFNGLLTFAVKSNPDPIVLKEMVNSGVSGFDVASPAEITLMRDLAPNAALHYNNPIRTKEEIQFALENNVRSYSVDCLSELLKIESETDAAMRAEIEISVRIKLDLSGSAYHFGSKFGATEVEAIEVLKAARDAGFRTSMTFHVGTQTEKPANYKAYTEAAARIAKFAGVKVERVNVGGGFPSARGGKTPDYQAFFDVIHEAVESFDEKPALVCEPGRALVGDCMDYAVRVKSIAPNRWVFLTDGIYGGLSEINIISPLPRIAFFAPNGERRTAQSVPTKAYGPTCDSIDALKEPLQIPSDVEDGDIVLISGLGAYINGPNTRFNGYGDWEFVNVDSL